MRGQAVIRGSEPRSSLSALILRKRESAVSKDESPADATTVVTRFCDKLYKVTSMTSSYVTQHHHSNTSPLYEIRNLALGHSTHIAMHCHECRLAKIEDHA